MPEAAQNLRDSKQYELPSYSTPAIAAASFCRSFAASRSSKSPRVRRSTWEASTPAPGCDLFLISADKARTLSDLNYESLSADEEAE